MLKLNEGFQFTPQVTTWYLFKLVSRKRDSITVHISTHQLPTSYESTNIVITIIRYATDLSWCLAVWTLSFVPIFFSSFFRLTCAASPANPISWLLPRNFNRGDNTASCIKDRWEITKANPIDTDVNDKSSKFTCYKPMWTSKGNKIIIITSNYRKTGVIGVWM